MADHNEFGLIEILDLSELAENLFQGESPIRSRQSVYGGQVAAQALEAARRTLANTDQHLHSLHGYFIRAGDETKPIIYDVSRTRDGRSFSTRGVVARQAGGAIFSLTASYHRDEPDMEYYRDSVDPHHDLPAPEDCEVDDWDEVAEVRVVPTGPGRSTAWIRIAQPARLGDDRWLHAEALAYASDSIPMNAIGSVRDADNHEYMMTSLDHSLWLHSPARADEWLLIDMYLQSVRGSRGVASGTIRTADGKLVATVAQEGLVRRIVEKA